MNKILLSGYTVAGHSRGRGGGGAGGWRWSGPCWRSGAQLTSEGSFHSCPPPSPLKRKERQKKPGVSEPTPGEGAAELIRKLDLFVHRNAARKKQNPPHCFISPPSPSTFFCAMERLFTLRKMVDCSPPGSPVHGIFQARILECVAISFLRVSSRPRDGTHISCTGICHCATWEAHLPVSSFATDD